LDVNWCNREGLLQPGQAGTITWQRDRDGEKAGSIVYEAIDDGDDRVTALRLLYTISTRGMDDSRHVDYEIALEWTSCNFGGEHPWFRCPECYDRVGKLYVSQSRDTYVCRECEGLLYESQTYTPATMEAIERLENARTRLEEGWPTRDRLREYYDALSGQIGAFNSYMNRLDTMYGSDHVERHKLTTLPPYEVWLDRQLSQIFGSGIRPYGHYGRCTATAKTTDERCRQPAIGEHGKCYYHGGAPGSGIGEDQRDHAAEQFQELIDEVEVPLRLTPSLAGERHPPVPRTH
jgi:hypothetical protein